MSINDYLKEVLKSQELNNGELETLSDHRSEVEGYLREKFGEDWRSGEAVRVRRRPG